MGSMAHHIHGSYMGYETWNHSFFRFWSSFRACLSYNHQHFPFLDWNVDLAPSSSCKNTIVPGCELPGKLWKTGAQRSKICVDHGRATATVRNRPWKSGMNWITVIGSMKRRKGLVIIVVNSWRWWVLQRVTHPFCCAANHYSDPPVPATRSCLASTALDSALKPRLDNGLGDTRGLRANLQDTV